MNCVLLGAVWLWLACIVAASVCLPANAQVQTERRQLVAVTAPNHDPLFVDMSTLQRNGRSVSFKYVLDVFVTSAGKSAPGEWKSNEIEASIDCAQKTFTVRRLVAYSGPRASGAPSGMHSFMAPSRPADRISPRSTFAYIEAHLCAIDPKKG